MLKQILLVSLCSALFCCQSLDSVGLSRSAKIIDISPTPVLHFDVGKGHSGGSIALNFKFQPKQDFKTQGVCTIDTHLQSYRLFLIDASTALPIPGNDISARVTPSSTFFPVTKQGISSPSGNQQVLLTNVQTGTWAVAIAAYDNINGTDNNISIATGAHLISAPTTGNVFVTSTGGNSNSGTVIIGGAPNFNVTGVAPLNVTLTLDPANINCL